MKEISLSEFVKECGQRETARLLGVTQGAVCQMLNNAREITVVVDCDGVVSAYERKQIGKQR